MIQLLLELGADNQSTIGPSSPITYAAHHGKFAEASQLLDARTDFAFEGPQEPYRGPGERYELDRHKALYICGVVEAHHKYLPVELLYRLPARLSEKQALFTRLTKLLSLKPGWGDEVIRGAVNSWPWMSTAILGHILENLSSEKKSLKDYYYQRDYQCLPGIEMGLCFEELLDAHNRIWDATRFYDRHNFSEMPLCSTRRTKAAATTATAATSTVTESRDTGRRRIDDEGDVALFNAMNQNFGDIVKVLLDYGDGIKLDIPIRRTQATLLTCAVDRREKFGGFCMDVVLVEATRKNWSGRKKKALGEALFCALQSNDAEAARVLVRHGAVADIPNHPTEKWVQCHTGLDLKSWRIYGQGIRRLYERVKKEVEAGVV
ncbi:hypothetical protein B0T21DRAFT_449067 [Apiosordaria backusii]|uniref:Ankyrin repeat protein n=1 Tax=Apiosordaria backusii TaxID=314023 RepID=A0AA40K1N3_9PEZI|nr:hypothetical protein B0T21DRAFT_449067 [Apiosordaria backusii]